MNFFTSFYLWIRKHLLDIDDRSQLDIAIDNGLKIGNNCHIMGECIIDPGHCWLIEIGDRVTLAPRVHVLAHDASTKRLLDYTLINKVIIGAGSVVKHSIPDNSVAVGNPAKVICTFDEYRQKREKQLANTVVFDESFTIHQITEEKKQLMKEKLSHSIGFVK